ncbi:transposase [Echinicola sediminis]
MLNFQEDHVHLIREVAPKVLISKIESNQKGRTATGVFGRFKDLRQHVYVSLIL